ncbi:Hpt domain-containing protein [Coleofasciculus sp. LEGE 07092]|nr:Hpt domain-containing protein [Coleofasciculus sp. LEGE 07081]MBE9147332.1 Hpt domain-containing protein [Coleofasciculus sp. LEGE 07092]
MIEDEELRTLYKISAEERLQKLDMGLRHFQEYPDEEATLEQLLREAHSLKGDSRSLGVDTVEVLTYRIEEILGCIKRKQTAYTPQVNEFLYHGLDAISRLVQEAVTGEPSGVDTVEILDRLTNAVSESEQQKLEGESKEEFAFQRFIDNGNLSTTATAIAQINDNTSQLASTYIDDEELRTLYQFSSEERLQKLEIGLRHLQQYPNDETTLDELRREVHGLKGDSSSVGIDDVETLAHGIEEILENIRTQEATFTPLVSESLDYGLEAIALLVREAVTGEPSQVDIAGVIEQLMEALWASNPPQPNAPSQLAPSYIEDDELREVYHLSSEERLQKLEAGLLHLEKHSGDITTLEELLREAHSLKGDSRSAGVDDVETIIHQIEEILGNIQHQQTVLTPEVSDRLYQGLDATAKLIQEAVTGQLVGVDTPGVVEQLMEIVVAPATPEALPVSPTESPITATPDISGEPYHIDTIRVQTRDLDALMAQAEELNVTKIHITHATTEIEELVSLWQEWKGFEKRKSRAPSSVGINPHQERLDEIINALRSAAQENSSNLDLIAGDLRDKIRTLRLLPLSTVFQFFPRMVRDLARQQSKQVEFVIEGGETAADKRILEEIKDSLMHLIRNAIDHGIETPDEREQRGKPATATIWLRGYQSGNTIVIEVADDGRGLDVEKIKQTAIRRKLYQKEELDAMTPSQIYELIFAPGFSTRSFITEISGRGIGLDVVRTHIERLKGTITIASTPNQGSSFRIQLRTTLATINALMLEVEGIIQALPIEFVETSLLVSPEQIFTIDGRESIDWDGKAVPLSNLVDLLELSNSPAYAFTAKIEPQTSDWRPCILLKVGEDYAGLLVDRLFDTQELALKPQSQLLKRVRNVMGATILPTGDVCTILNPPDLIKSLQKQTPTTISVKPIVTIQHKPLILLVEDSLPVRTQEKRLLEKAGYEVVIAINGLDGYNKLQTRNFDAVISDVEMPHLDGLSMTAKIRQHPDYQDLPIILVTTLNSDEDKQRSAVAGADAHIIKGKFNQDFLLETLGRFV